ncbi:MAG: cytidine deaminase [Pseudomonadota bacterium]
MLSQTDKDRLIKVARDARATAYVPYSNYRVGAAILADDGTIYGGCNVENAAYPQGTCAETGAIAAMALGGGKDILAIAVAGGKRDTDLDDGKPWDTCSPCGGCRQRIAEFARGDVPVIIVTPHEIKLETTVGDLLPHAFNLKEA